MEKLPPEDHQKVVTFIIQKDSVAADLLAALKAIEMETREGIQKDRIAADLLAALKAIEMETREGGQWTPAEINEVARAAIAKASEGK